MKTPVYWYASFLLILPVTILYAVLFLCHRSGVHFTGFIQGDMAVYMANAREHFDNGNFRFSYANPFSPEYTSRPIYFQPQTLLLALAWKLTGMDPGAIFLIFGFASALVCALAILLLFKSLFGLDGAANKLGLVLFFWGGGLASIAGIAGNIFSHRPLYDDVFRFDPGRGWWFLSLGRNLVYPTEALYHALFVAIICLVVSSRFKLSYVLSILLIFAHPFTGFELTLILAVWALLEYFVVKQHVVPWHFPFAQILFLGVIYGYYSVFLGTDVEHRSVQKQLALLWTYGWVEILLGYSLVGVLAAWGFRSLRSIRATLGRGSDRLLLVWFLVALALSKHEWFMPPMQPLHFTRGYVWAPLFLLGFRHVRPLVMNLVQLKHVSLRYGLLACGILLLISDNLLWFSHKLVLAPRSEQGIYKTAEEDELLLHLNRDGYHRHLVVTSDQVLAYLINVYTPLRTAFSHWANTPDIQEQQRKVRAFFMQGEIDPSWPSSRLLIVCRRPFRMPEPHAGHRVYEKVFEDGGYVIYHSSSSPAGHQGP